LQGYATLEKYVEKGRTRVIRGNEGERREKEGRKEGERREKGGINEGRNEGK
jgi:hypothetical protein